MKTLLPVALALVIQFLCLAAANSQTWIQSTNAPDLEWWSVASSADGTRLAAVAYGAGIYTSTNAGLTWISNSAPKEDWYCVASSADGTKLAAGIDLALSTGGGIFTNAGVTWMATSAPNRYEPWNALAASTNGNNFVASGSVVGNPIEHVVYTSNNSGYTWNAASLPNLYWIAVGSSADGTKLVALANGTNAFYSSSDSGTTWVSNSMPNNTWYCVASSADGTKLTAGAGPAVNGGLESGDGLLYTSTNSGETWTPDNVPGQNWYSVASSLDGTKLVACSFSPIGTIYTSADSGQTWISNNVPNYPWASVASSADGTRLVAVAATGQIYTALPATPSLSCRLSGTNFVVSWPSADAGFQLQQSSNLRGNSWTTVTNFPIATDGQDQVTVAATSRQIFYRLAP